MGKTGEKLHIAIFTNNYLPNPYGVSASIESFRQKLITDGHVVYIFAPQWKGGAVVQKEEKNVFRYPSIDVPTKVDFSLVVPYAPKIDAVLEKLQIDIVHAQHPILLGSTARKWAKKKNVPLIFTWHTLYDLYTHYMPFVPQHVSGKVAIHNAVSYANACDHVIVPTPIIYRAIRDFGVVHDRISIIPSGVDEELFADPQGEKIREKYHYTKKDLVLVTVSRLTEEKNVVFLAQSVAEILQKNPHVKFLCAGEGDLLDEMQDIFVQKKVSERVIFAGVVQRSDVKDYLAAGDIFVYASTSETQGTIVTENMYVGKPIIAVGVNGVKDLVEHEINGLETKEDHSFVDAIQRMIDDAELRDRMGRNAARIAREKYTATVCAKKLLATYYAVIEKYHSM
ncbi:MAG: glycosyltransferase [Parcubacteria group bacterium]|jgi:glycosyltransferase involved in cell wall biosynthesis